MLGDRNRYISKKINMKLRHAISRRSAAASHQSGADGPMIGAKLAKRNGKLVSETVIS